MIRPSPELAAIVARWNDAVISRDGETLRNLLSTASELRYVGSAEDEMWSGEVLRQGIADHFREIPDFEQGPFDIEAYENGDTGWALWTGKFTFSGTTNVTATHRITFVFALEAGAWKIVHIHISNPTSNVEKMGIEHRALSDLVAAAREGFRLDQREGLATVMFTDIADSATLAELLGDRAWASTVRNHLEQVTQAIETEGGRLIKSLGDGTMSTFTSARPAIRAAQAIMQIVSSLDTEPVLQLRIGLHTGDVVEAGDDFFGTVVNKAARIASVARPGEIRVSDTTRITVGGDAEFGFQNPSRIALKGLEGDHLVHSLRWRE